MHAIAAAVALFDETIVHFFNQYAGRNPAFDVFIGDIAASALLKGGLFMAYFWWVWFHNGHRDQILERRRNILVALAGALLAVVLARVLQRLLPYHARPLHAAIGFVLPHGVNPETLSDWNSFPSDHAALFTALSVAIFLHRRWIGAVAMLWTLVVICLPRIYLGYHYPSDVAGGVVLGAAVMLLTQLLAHDARWPRHILAWEATHRTVFYCLAFLASYELSVLFYDVRALASDGLAMFRSVQMIAAI